MDYKVIKSNRKSISLSISDTLVPIVRAPYFAADSEIDKFVNSHIEWIEKAIQDKKKYLDTFELSDDELNELKAQAREYIPKRVEYYSALMSLSPSSVKITSAKKRFGSCSGKNSLCFSCYLMKYPKQAIDYVIVHELAHIKHHNHSKSFYSLIKNYMPDYKEREKLLKNRSTEN